MLIHCITIILANCKYSSKLGISKYSFAYCWSNFSLYK